MNGRHREAVSFRSIHQGLLAAGHRFTLTLGRCGRAVPVNHRSWTPFQQGLLDAMPLPVSLKEVVREFGKNAVYLIAIGQPKRVDVLYWITATLHHPDHRRISQKHDRLGVESNQAFEDTGHQQILGAPAVDQRCITSRCAAAPFENVASGGKPNGGMATEITGKMWRCRR